MGFLDRLQRSWNAFMNKDPTMDYRNLGMSYSHRPDRPRLTRGNEKTIVTSVYNRIAIDIASIGIKHCRLDENERFIGTIDSGLNNCLNLEANIDQTGRAFIQDVVMSMLDEGVVALVPVDTSDNPMDTSSYDILTMRTGKIVQWYPSHVKVQVYNDRKGDKEEIIVSKRNVGIIENPLYAVINEPNSTMQRLIRKLSLLDVVDEQSSAGKLDLIIQLPYAIKSESRRQQAETRRKDIESQLMNSKYGIAYADSTERITQLNRSLENNLMKQIEYLTNLLFSQLGITQSILEGTADEQTMLNYNNRTIEPIISAIVDEMKRKFLTQTARTQRQTIMFFRDPFKLVPVNNMAEIADKFTRNEIMTSNEIRQIVGLKPAGDPKADQLINSNLNHPETTYNVESEQQVQEQEEPIGMTFEEYKKTIEELDNFDKQLDDLEGELPSDKDLKHYASPYYDPVKAHEYYMKNRELKGRKSTTTLNDEGKAAAEYVRNQLRTERKSKVDANNETVKSQIATTKAIVKDQVNSNKEAMRTDLDGRRKRMSDDIKKNREQMNAKVKSHSKETSTKIASLREKLKKMTTEQRASHEESIMKEIDSLREDNNSIREKLKTEYSEYSSKLKSEHSEYSNSLKKQIGDENTRLREAQKSASDKARSDVKAEATRLKEYYDDQYLSELDKIKSNEKFIKTSKKKKK